MEEGAGDTPEGTEDQKEVEGGEARADEGEGGELKGDEGEEAKGEEGEEANGEGVEAKDNVGEEAEPVAGEGAVDEVSTSPETKQGEGAEGEDEVEGDEEQESQLTFAKLSEDREEGDEDDLEHEESEFDYVQFPYGPHYKEITHERLKEIAHELSLIRVCWPETDLDPHVRKHYPPAYSNNTTKEKLLLFFTENFRRQFHFQHIERKPILLAAENECGLQKMVCTTIRLTCLHYPEMNTFQGCAQFVADHIVYEPLEPVTLLPFTLRSPAFTLVNQKGHCFEMATLLCSYLTGACYDAYVVSGYASLELCTNDCTRFDCPYIEVDKVTETEEVDTTEHKYQVRPPRDLRSKFVVEMEAREVRKAEAAARKIREEAVEAKMEFEKPKEDEYRGLRVHSWVLVLPPGRQVDKPFFIEPASGVCYDVSYNHYFDIESLWSHENYWLNVQKTSEGCSQINFDLNDCKIWEHVLPGEPWLNRKTVERTEDEIQITLQEKHLDVPTSWVERLEIDNSVFEQRFPQGNKVTYFHKSKVELYAPYIQRDGLVKRVTTYLDSAWNDPEMIYEYYSDREDLMFKNVINVQTDIAVEHFIRGREESLKMHTHTQGDSSLQGVRSLEFYDQARYDGLRLLDMDPLYMTTQFIDRLDYLYYRHAEFLPRSGGPGVVEVRRSVNRLTERFHRNPEKQPGNDIAQRVFAIGDNEILLKYHFEPGRYSAETREFIKPPPTEMGDRLVFNPNLTCGYNPRQNAPPPKTMDLFVLFQDLLRSEESSLYFVRDYEDEVGLILRNRINELGMKKLVVSIFDKERNEAALHEMQELEESERIKKMMETLRRVDYLAPYFARRGNPETVNRHVAQEIREECLNDYKQLLVDRANRMQAEFENVSLALLESYAWYEKNQELITREEEEEYFESTNNKKFILNTLEIRLNRHKEMAPLKYLNVETSVMLDKRMSVLNY